MLHGPVSREVLRVQLQRSIFQIRDTDATLVVAQLLFLEAEDSSKPIHLYINSPGGSVTAGLAIYDTVCTPNWKYSLGVFTHGLILDAGKLFPLDLILTVLTPEKKQYVSSPIHTYSIGLAASMGSLLLAAGEKGKRHCLPNASIMIHRWFPLSIPYTCLFAYGTCH